MPLLFWLLLPVAGLLTWFAWFMVNQSAVRQHDHSGDPADGILIFVEPVRWMFIIWGFTQFSAGMRRAGLRTQTRLFRWSDWLGAVFVLPDLMRHARLLRQADRFARYLDEVVEKHPHTPLHIASYSTGCFIALEGCLRMKHAGAVSKVILLGGTTSPHYDLRPLHGRVERIFNFYSRLDLINMIGPLLFGSNDRRWGFGCGVRPFIAPPPFVEQRGWRPADIRYGYCGDHFTLTSPAFTAACIVPLLTGQAATDAQPAAAEPGG